MTNKELARLKAKLEYEIGQSRACIERMVNNLKQLGFDPEENDHVWAMREGLECMHDELAQLVCEEVMRNAQTGRVWCFLDNQGGESPVCYG